MSALPPEAAKRPHRMLSADKCKRGAQAGLYHYTIPENALLIALGGGLKPGLGLKGGQNAYQTLGMPVVWLTKEQTNIATADDVALMKCGEVGGPRYGGEVRCEVHIERSKHLQRYLDFLKTTDRKAIDPATGEISFDGTTVLTSFPRHSSFRSWWIYDREIPRSKIMVPLTREQAIAGCQWHVETSPDAEGVKERWQSQLDEFARAPTGTVFLFNDGEFRCYQKAA
jgi:hypothetical protein